MTTDVQSRDGTPSSSGWTRGSLLSRARSRDAAAWVELVDLYGPLVAHWCRRCGLDPHAAADCVQEVFASVAKSLPKYAPNRGTGSFRGWLWTITSNKIRDHLHRKRRQPEAYGGSTAYRRLGEVAAMSEDEPTTAGDVRQLVSRSIAQIRGEFEPRTWAIFERAVVDGIDTATVAAEFDVQPAAVRQTRSRILRRLRQQLGDLD